MDHRLTLVRTNFNPTNNLMNISTFSEVFINKDNKELMRSRRRSCVVETEGQDDTTASSRPHQNPTTLLSSEPNNTTPMPVCCVFLCRKGTSVEKISARVECLSCSRKDPCESAKTCFCSVAEPMPRQKWRTDSNFPQLRG